MYKQDYKFPAIITMSGGCDVEIKVYDFKDVIVYGDDLDECFQDIEQALEAEIYKYISLNKEIPKETPQEDIKLDYNQTILTLKVNTEIAIKNSKRLGISLEG